MNMQFPTGGNQRTAAAAHPNVVDLPLVPRIGVISNARSHRNRTEQHKPLILPTADVIRHVPETREALAQTLHRFAAEGVEVIVIDGGDGTVREVLGAAHRAYRGHMPRFAVLRSGKTNALALDLDIPRDWGMEEILASHQADRVAERSPIHVRWTNGRHRDQFGFIFGFGAFVRATSLAQKVHKRGWFNGVAVVLTLAWAILQTLFGSPNSPWKRGDVVRMSRDAIDIVSETMYIIFGSTLRNMPMGLKPFGPPRDGLKFLTIKAPPKHLVRLLPKVLRGTQSERLERNGYVRRDDEHVFLSISKSFILDGERFPGGNLSISRGAPVEFVVP